MKTNKLKQSIQLTFFVLIGLIVLNHFIEESGRALAFIPSISLHAVCPFGAVETFYSLVFLGTYIPKIHQSTVVLFSIILLTSILFGPLFCGYICPLGSIQEWFGKIGKKIFKKRYNHFVPIRADKKLRYLRYVVLLFTIYITGKSLTLIFLEVDPFHALFNFYTGEATIGGLIILGLTLTGALFIERPWCKYLCPYGALLGVTNTFRLLPIKRQSENCTSCSVCDDVCPMNIEVSRSDVIRNHQCISCHDCLSDMNCPVENTVVIESIFQKEA